MSSPPAGTPLYDKLNPGMQGTVDAWVERLQPLPWRRRSDLLVEASLPWREEFEPDQARQLTRGFITAVLERLGEPEVRNAHQAVAHLLSLHPEHHEQARAWLAEHGEVREVVEKELAGWDLQEREKSQPHDPDETLH